jgi:hypothetical protein
VYALNGEEPPASVDTWRALNSVYVERLGPAAATIGPPPGWDDATNPS